MGGREEQFAPGGGHCPPSQCPPGLPTWVSTCPAASCFWVTSLPAPKDEVARAACRQKNPGQESGGLAQLRMCRVAVKLLALSGPQFPLLHNKEKTGLSWRAFSAPLGSKLPLRRGQPAAPLSSCTCHVNISCCASPRTASLL